MKIKQIYVLKIFLLDFIHDQYVNINTTRITRCICFINFSIRLLLIISLFKSLKENDAWVKFMCSKSCLNKDIYGNDFTRLARTLLASLEQGYGSQQFFYRIKLTFLFNMQSSRHYINTFQNLSDRTLFRLWIIILFSFIYNLIIFKDVKNLFNLFHLMIYELFLIVECNFS